MCHGQIALGFPSALAMYEWANPPLFIAVLKKGIFEFQHQLS